MSEFKHDAVTVLTSGIVIDKRKMEKLDAVNMGAVFAQVYQMGKPVHIVEDRNNLFSQGTLLTYLSDGDEKWRIIAEYFELDLSDSELDTLFKATEIRKKIVDRLKLKRKPYEWADIPKGWSVNNYLSISGNSVQRQRYNPDGDQAHYAMGRIMLARLWDAARPAWSGEEPLPKKVPDISADGSNRKTVVQKDHITVGCQTIRRYELEQLAKHLNWTMPE